jgi:hypothetical protein
VVRLGRTIFPPDLNSVSRFGGREMADIVTQFLKLENFQVERERERERLSGGGWISLKREEECCWWWGALQM